mgnify:CR=1 FL=1
MLRDAAATQRHLQALATLVQSQRHLPSHAAAQRWLRLLQAEVAERHYDDPQRMLIALKQGEVAKAKQALEKALGMNASFPGSEEAKGALTAMKR